MDGVDVGLFILRVVVGALFVGHGTQKLFGWFRGYGLEGTGGWLESLGFRPGRTHATLGGVAEAGGGLLLVLGFLTPLGAAAIIGTMASAALSVHRPHGMWITENGMEYVLVLGSAAAAIAFAGPGSASFDNAFGLDLHGWGWGLAAVAIGGGAAAAILNSRQLEPQGETEVRGSAETAVPTER
jgi:putative oxidoreductase